MKNWKQYTLIVFMALLVFTFIGCDPEIKYVDKEVPDPTLIFREATINLDLNGTARTVRVEGTLLATEWNGLADKVKTAIQNAYSTTGGSMAGNFEDVLNRTGFTLVVTKEDYPFYRANHGFTLYLNINKLNDADWSEKIIEAMAKMISNSYPAIG